MSTTDAVSVFVYDTSLDSDGGLWTEQCGKASWYQETLNTATRGVKKNFPKVALLVLRSGSTGSLTIYDALDIDSSGPKLWMRFDVAGTVGTNGFAVGDSNSAMRGAFALNGRIYVASSNMLTAIDFPNDVVVNYNSTGTYRFANSISRRNVASRANLISTNSVADSNCSNVHARVLPGAPLDIISGLPIPTVAVSAASSVSVIHPNGLVANITGHTNSPTVFILQDGSIASSRTTNNTMAIYQLPFSDVLNSSNIEGYQPPNNPNTTFIVTGKQIGRAHV